MAESNTAGSLFDTFAVMSDAFDVDTLRVTDSIYAQLDERYNGFSGHLLIACHRFDSDWPTWEVHPKGDEIVCLLSGCAEMLLRTPEGDVTRRLDTPGEFVVVPRGSWHTTHVSEPTSMLFITPGEGTENRETPG
jgi:mannose-6-phosphate isomerase-like protein (cupin superfamily)